MPHEPPAPQPPELVLANARLVLAHEVVRGSLCVRDGRIAAIDQGAATPKGAIDCDGDLLAPGLIELHTDNLERHLEPRPGVHWPAPAAIVAHDAELAGCGITTVFDALRVGSLVAGGRMGYRKYARPLATEIVRLHRAGWLRIRHRLHLRAEILLRDPDRGAGRVRPGRPRRHRQPHGPHPRPAPVHRAHDAARLRQGPPRRDRRGVRQARGGHGRARRPGRGRPRGGGGGRGAAARGGAGEPRRHHRGACGGLRCATGRASPSSRPRRPPPPPATPRASR